MEHIQLRQRCEGKFRRALGVALMYQQVVAGVGDIYSDEILFQAHLYAKPRIERLDDATLEKLFQETRHVLKTAIERGANPQKLPDHFLLSHRREGRNVRGARAKSRR